MITIDTAVGSRELLRHFPPNSALLDNIGFADFLWIGTGNVVCCAERKTVSDMITCIWNSRFTGEQLPKMQDNSDVQYLIIEGTMYRHYQNNSIVVDGKPFPVNIGYNRVIAALMTYQEIAGLKVIRTHNSRDTANWVYTMADWWSRDRDSHTSHKGMYVPSSSSGDRTTLCEKMATQLPGIAWKIAHWIDTRWGLDELLTVMLESPTNRWGELPRIGKRGTQAINNYIQKERKR